MARARLSIYSKGLLDMTRVDDSETQMFRMSMPATPFSALVLANCTLRMRLIEITILFYFVDVSPTLTMSRWMWWRWNLRTEIQRTVVYDGYFTDWHCAQSYADFWTGVQIHYRLCCSDCQKSTLTLMHKMSYDCKRFLNSKWPTTLGSK